MSRESSTCACCGQYECACVCKGHGEILSPEAQRVLDASGKLFDCGVEARGWWDGKFFHGGSNAPISDVAWLEFVGAVKELRASLAPAQRWETNGCMVCDNHTLGRYLVARDPENAKLIRDALNNAAEERKP